MNFSDPNQNEKRDTLSSALEQVRQKFLDRLPEIILALETIAFSSPGEAPSSKDLEEIRLICHKLAGTAPTLNFIEIGSKARELEFLLASKLVREDYQKVWATAEKPLENLLDRLELALDEA